jgi:hypothetical protein
VCVCVRSRRLPVWGNCWPLLRLVTSRPPLGTLTLKHTHTHRHTCTISLLWDFPSTPPEGDTRAHAHTHTHTQGSNGGPRCHCRQGLFGQTGGHNQPGTPRRPTGRRQEAQSLGAHHPSRFGGSGYGVMGGPQHAGRQLRVYTDRQTPPPSAAAAFLDTPPPTSQPQTPGRTSSPGRWPSHERPLGAGRTHPDRHPPAGRQWPREAAGRRVAAAAAAACRSRSGRDSHTRSVLAYTLTRVAINIQSPSIPARRPTAPPPGLPRDPSSFQGWGPLPSSWDAEVRGCK